jgi:hypothetical protein
MLWNPAVEIAGLVWLVPSLLLVTVSVLSVTVGQRDLPLRLRVRRVALDCPLAFLWPFLLLVAWYQVRREQILEKALRGHLAFRHGPLTEEGWREGDDAVVILARGRQRLSSRKRHLLAAAFCRRIWHRLLDPRSRQAVEVAERFADGLANETERRLAAQEAQRAAALIHSQGDLELACAAWACHDACTGSAILAASRSAHAVFSARRQESRCQCEVLREILGDPFHPLPARDFPPHICALAHEVAAGEEALWPILADALSELGEEAAAAHCRQEGHLKGCHVLDWILGLS